MTQPGKFPYIMIKIEVLSSVFGIPSIDTAKIRQFSVTAKKKVKPSQLLMFAKISP